MAAPRKIEAQVPPAGIVLVGGGHAHVAVLADWIANGLPYARATLVTPAETLRYSGMVPGWIAGSYDRDEGLVDVGALARKAGVRLVLDRCVGIDPADRLIVSEEGQRIAFDIASIDTGGVERAAEVLGNDGRVIDIRPIDRFVRIFAKQRASIRPGHDHIVVAGGGAGGTELALGLRNMAKTPARPCVTLVAGEGGLLPEFSRAVRATTAKEFERQGIEVVACDARIVSGQVRAGERSLEPVDMIVAALGSAAPHWPRESGLACDARGFIQVDRHQRSVSHPHVFAVGDVAARQDRAVPHSGVHAVFAGPVLAANLRALAEGRAARRSYTPRWNNFYLMTTGDGAAIASYGPFAAKGRWVSKLKDWIDRRWIAKYARAGRNRSRTAERMGST